MDLNKNNTAHSLRTTETARPSEVVLPDISKVQKTAHVGSLSQVGMGQIEMPILFELNGRGQILLPASIDAFVSLDDPEAKGIHMSRLYLEVKKQLQNQPLNATTLQGLLESFLNSHEDLSESAYIVVRFQLPLERKALLSGEMGFRQYPVTLRAHLRDGRFDFTIGAEILYSSTCPCSAALARQLVMQEFSDQFKSEKEISKNSVLNWLMKEDSIVAIPHAQRSLARVHVKLQPGTSDFDLMTLIDMAESAVGTPVQAAVKRVDEQEFARLNASNLMFCEDAARKLRGVFENSRSIADYSIYVEHQESLHPHNAVAREVKGVPDGFTID